jgi:hypothetical protein
VVLLLLLLLQSVVRSAEEWQRVLSPGQYKILRQAGTELPRTRWDAARSNLQLHGRQLMCTLSDKYAADEPQLHIGRYTYIWMRAIFWQLPAEGTTHMHTTLHLT